MDLKEKTIFSMLIQNLKQQHEIILVNILKRSKYQIQETRYDNWNFGTRYYTMYFYIKYDDFNNLLGKVKEEYEKKILNVISPLFDEDNDYMECVVIKPLLENYIDWDAIVGLCDKNKFKKMVETEKKYYMDVATGVRKIQECEKEYLKLESELKVLYGKLLITPPFDFNSLWDWYNYYNEQGLKTYQSRRNLLKQKYDPIFELIENSEQKETLFEYEKSGFELIDESIQNLKIDLQNAKDRIAFNQIGVRCRETIKLLANEVYIDSLHHPADYNGEVSKSDSKRMLDGYISYNFKGSANDEKRRYAKTTNDLANNLVHKETATLLDAKLCFTATLSLINIIKIIYEENPIF